MHEIWDAQLLRLWEGSKLMSSWLGTRITSALQLPGLIWAVSFLRARIASVKCLKHASRSAKRIQSREKDASSASNVIPRYVGRADPHSPPSAATANHKNACELRWLQDFARSRETNTLLLLATNETRVFFGSD